MPVAALKQTACTWRTSESQPAKCAFSIVAVYRKTRKRSSLHSSFHRGCPFASAPRKPSMFHEVSLLARPPLRLVQRQSGRGAGRPLQWKKRAPDWSALLCGIETW